MIAELEDQMDFWSAPFFWIKAGSADFDQLETHFQIYFSEVKKNLDDVVCRDAFQIVENFDFSQGSDWKTRRSLILFDKDFLQRYNLTCFLVLRFEDFAKSSLANFRDSHVLLSTIGAVGEIAVEHRGVILKGRLEKHVHDVCGCL